MTNTAVKASIKTRKRKRCSFEECNSGLLMEAFVLHMAPHGRVNDAASRGVPMELLREEFAGRTALKWR